METVFYQLPVQAGPSAVSFTQAIPQFSGTAAAEIVNTTYWIVETGN